MFDDWTKCDDCSPERIIQEIEMCGFECIAGKLENHIGWIALKKRVADLQALFKSNCKVESIAIAKYAESQKRVAELEAGLKASEEKMRLHAGDCCSLNNEVELFRSQRDDAHDELIIVKHRLAELNMAASKIVLMFDGPDDFNIEPKHIEDIREALSPTKDGE